MPMSQEAREKQRQRMMGNKFRKGKLAWNKGIKGSTKKKNDQNDNPTPEEPLIADAPVE